jgi:ABC-type lipoprotein export system ATPase subunit
MLKYIDFVSSSGLKYVGNTEGNLARIHKDLSYMRKDKYDINCGIMSLQKHYLDSLRQHCKEAGKDFDEVLGRLENLTQETDENRMRECLNALDPSEWFMFRKVLRFPIPYYIGGLDDYAKDFIKKYNSCEQRKSEGVKRVANCRVSISDLRINSKYKVPDSINVRVIKDCFGLEGDLLSSKILGPITVEASPGNIILITGPSGSGKSILLKSLDPDYELDSVEFKNRVFPKNYKVAWMREIDSSKPLIEHFCEKWKIERTISALNYAGLSEAFVYLKPYKFLSRGQRYRARIAELSLGQEPVLLMDEFCADLDQMTAKIVASNLRKLIIKTGRIAFVAAANSSHFIEGLKPTQVIYLRQNAAKIMSYKEYVDEFFY